MASKKWLWGLAGAAFVAVGLFALAIGLLIHFLPEMKAYSPVGKKIAVLDVRGPIVNTEKQIEILHQYRDDATVGAIIVYIDSPGGAVGPTQELYDELLAVKEKDKKVYAYISDIGASGGYYLACAADKIYATPGSLVGSIGVIMTFTNVEGLFGKVGVSMKTIKTGAYKDIGSPYRPMTPEEETLLGATLDDVYQQFVDAVTTGRRTALARRIYRRGEPAPTKYAVRKYVEGYADGRVFSGRQARELGFVDENGNFEACVKDAAKAAGIKGEPALIRRRVKEPSLFDALTGKARLRLFGIPEPDSRIEIKYALY